MMKELFEKSLLLILDYCETFGTDEKEELFIKDYVLYCEQNNIEPNKRALNIMNNIVDDEPIKESEYTYLLNKITANCKVAIASDILLDGDTDYVDILDLGDWSIESVGEVMTVTGILKVDESDHDDTYVVDLNLSMVVDIERDSEGEMIKDAMSFIIDKILTKGKNYEFKMFEPYAEDEDIALRPI